MLKQIRALWKDGSVMLEALERLGAMVGDAEYVFTHAWETCTGQAVAEKIEEPIGEHDRAVNRSEREIRRLIAGHLSINPGQDVPGCMAVLLMAKDVERVGDHGRNIFSVGARMDGNAGELPLYAPLNAAAGKLAELFPMLQRAILESDEELTHEILERYTSIKRDLKQLLKQLFETQMTGPQAVASALLTRYLMRINSHLGNAASGIIFPLENIDFVSRGLKEEEKDR
jgi:phosphate uptake regulator